MEKQKLYEKRLENYPKPTVVLKKCFAIALVWIRRLRYVCIEICWVTDNFHSLYAICYHNARIHFEKTSMHALLLLQQIM